MISFHLCRLFIDEYNLHETKRFSLEIDLRQSLSGVRIFGQDEASQEIFPFWCGCIIVEVFSIP
jgi:hypothetical protein